MVIISSKNGINCSFSRQKISIFSIQASVSSYSLQGPSFVNIIVQFYRSSLIFCLRLGESLKGRRLFQRCIETSEIISVHSTIFFILTSTISCVSKATLCWFSRVSYMICSISCFHCSCSSFSLSSSCSWGRSSESSLYLSPIYLGFIPTG